MSFWASSGRSWASKMARRLDKALIVQGSLCYDDDADAVALESDTLLGRHKSIKA